MNKFSTLSEENNLCLSSIIIVGIIIVIRILALQRYNMYQLKFNGYYNNQQMDKRSDTIITLILNVIGITLSLYISFEIL